MEGVGRHELVTAAMVKRLQVRMSRLESATARNDVAGMLTLSAEVEYLAKDLREHLMRTRREEEAV